MESFVFAPAWAHLGLLLMAGMLFAATGPRRIVAGTLPIGVGFVWLAMAQVFLALAALCITYLDPFGEAGCRIGLAGYALHPLAVVVAAALAAFVAFVVLRARKFGKAMAARLIAVLCAEGVLTLEALAIHARSLGFCIGSV